MTIFNLLVLLPSVNKNFTWPIHGPCISHVWAIRGTIILFTGFLGDFYFLLLVGIQKNFSKNIHSPSNAVKNCKNVDY